MIIVINENINNNNNRMYLPLESGVMTWWLGEKPSSKKQE